MHRVWKRGKHSQGEWYYLLEDGTTRLLPSQADDQTPQNVRQVAEGNLAATQIASVFRGYIARRESIFNKRKRARESSGKIAFMHAPARCRFAVKRGITSP